MCRHQPATNFPVLMATSSLWQECRQNIRKKKENDKNHNCQIAKLTALILNVLRISSNRCWVNYSPSLCQKDENKVRSCLKLNSSSVAELLDTGSLLSAHIITNESWWLKNVSLFNVESRHQGAHIWTLTKLFSV